MVGLSELKIKLITVGVGRIGTQQMKFDFSRHVDDDSPGEENPYSLMDILVVPSRQDNSPNVIGEALMNGVPVIGSNVGGIPELLHPFEMETLDTTDPQLLASSILNASGKQFDRNRIREQAKSIFGVEAVGNQVRASYEKAFLSNL